MALTHFLAVLLLASAASAQVTWYCPGIGGSGTYNWNPDFQETAYVQTSFGSGTGYLTNMNCYFQITASIPGRVIVNVLENDISSYGASISIRTTILSGYLTDWNRYTYNPDRHNKFISTQNQLYISFTTGSASVSPGISRGVRLALTFLRPNACPPSFLSFTLANRPHCVGRPATKVFQFGEAQRYCNLQRSNLLVSDQNNVSSVLAAVSAANVWIGMTAEPSGSYSSYRWINYVGVSSGQAVQCSGDCKPGSTAHRCVYAADSRTLIQAKCSTELLPLCYMPAGGTDTFYAGSPSVRASGAFLAGAAVLLWSLVR